MLGFVTICNVFQLWVSMFPFFHDIPIIICCETSTCPLFSIDWPTDWQLNWLIDQLIDWPTDWLTTNTHSLIHQLIHLGQEVDQGWLDHPQGRDHALALARAQELGSQAQGTTHGRPGSMSHWWDNRFVDVCSYEYPLFIIAYHSLISEWSHVFRLCDCDSIIFRYIIHITYFQLHPVWWSSSRLRFHVIM